MPRGEHLGEFEQVVLLAVLRLDPDGNGVTIRAEIEARTGRDASVGAVYATLDRLEDKGSLESREGTPRPRRGGRAPRHYRITAEGRSALDEARRVLDALWEGFERGAGSA
ncbi:MAG: helix-turn-helix transcriptional regulator [Longimicrobiales bacterium]